MLLRECRNPFKLECKIPIPNLGCLLKPPRLFLQPSGLGVQTSICVGGRKLWRGVLSVFSVRDLGRRLAFSVSINLLCHLQAGFIRMWWSMILRTAAWRYHPKPLLGEPKLLGCLLGCGQLSTHCCYVLHGQSTSSKSKSSRATECQVGRDLKDHLVQLFLAKAQSGQAQHPVHLNLEVSSFGECITSLGR